MISRKEEQIKNARSFLRIGGFLIGLCIIFFLIIPIFLIYPLIPGVVCFLYGLKAFTSQKSYPRKLRDIFIIYGGSIVIFMSIPFLYYGRMAFILCDYAICPLSPSMAISIGISLLIFGQIILGFGINRMRLKSLKELTSNSKH